jgi:hypothetical protein
VQNVNVQLSHMLQSKEIDSGSAAATAQMLRMLGVTAKAMRATFLAGRSAELTSTMATASQRIEQLTLSDANSEVDLSLDRFVADLDADVLPRLSHVRIACLCTSACLSATRFDSRDRGIANVLE